MSRNRVRVRRGTMAMEHRGLLTVAVVLGALLQSSFGQTQHDRSQAPAQGDEQKESQSDEFLKQAKVAAAQYEITLQTEPLSKLNPMEGSILRWTNPVGEHQVLGEVFIWTDRGRPEVVLAVYRWADAAGQFHVHHEFSSLALGKLTALGPSQKIWSPSDAGVELQSLTDAPKPADSPTLRLQQMRELARRFTADKTTRQDVQRALRLLPQPVFRYEGDRPDLLDGALFAFVEGTDPEVFLLIEARADGQGCEWRYALARMNSVQLRAFCQDRLVWEAPTLAWREALDRPDRPYTAFQIVQE